MESKILTAFYEGKHIDFIAKMLGISPDNVVKSLSKQGVVLPEATFYDYGLVEMRKASGLIIQMGSKFSYCGSDTAGSYLAKAYTRHGHVPDLPKPVEGSEVSIEEHAAIVALSENGVTADKIAHMCNRSIGEIYTSINGLCED